MDQIIQNRPLASEMTLRDYFAAKVMLAGLSSAQNVHMATEKELFETAKLCYTVADAMLKAREQK